MENYKTFHSPQTINYGRNAFGEVGREAKARGKKAIIVSDKVMNDLEYVSECRDNLLKEGVDSVTYLGVDSEPTDIYVDEALTLFNEENCEIVISLGGGSCIDTAKSIAVLATNDGYIGDYMGMKKMAEVKPIPHIAIPTTAGTGSEVTDAVVIANTTTDVKMMIKQPSFLPEVAIVDPLLTLSSPKQVTAATGIDALSHAVEAYISKRSHPMTDDMALSAMKLIVENITIAYEDGDNLDARENMSLGAMQAGLAFSNASVCLVHGLSRPIGALFHVPHGFSNAMLLPAVLEFSKDYAIKRLADLGRIFIPAAENYSDEQAADVAVASVKSLCLKLNIPNLNGWGIDKTEFESVVSKMSKDALASGSPANNPRVPEQYEMEELYRVCFDYDFSTERTIK
ncbi:iron-containing alcohol dehydrogenase [Virgibacillus siamensis]|uniref:iron-containing alcohol dehydrogenase n=1 Tax=Virgibacillus siamensis TaxID=480071 RepID=UPI000984BD9F|nr:iron-containing alcohol dehydrogenase [Virgibacillus siamensis]